MLTKESGLELEFAADADRVAKRASLISVTRSFYYEAYMHSEVSAREMNIVPPCVFSLVSVHVLAYYFR